MPNWKLVRSLVPMLNMPTSGASRSAITAAAGTSTIAARSGTLLPLRAAIGSMAALTART